MGKTLQAKEERLKKKRLAEKSRREKIRKNPEAYAQFKKVRRDLYYKKKAENKIVPTSQLPQIKKRAQQERNKIACKKYREKLKKTKLNRTESLIATDLVPNTHDAVRDIDQDNDVRSNDILDFHQQLTSSTALKNKPVCSTAHVASVSPVSRLSRSVSRRLTYDTDRTSPALSSASSEVSSTGSLFERNAVNNAGSEKCKTPHNKSIRKLRYNMNREYKLLHNRIAELTKLNNKYRKQVSRLKQIANVTQSTSDTDSSCNYEKENIKNKPNLIKTQIEETVKKFYLDDDNSRMCPGKKECITRNKIKKQKRYLTESIQNLHKKFKQCYPQLNISYSHFWKLKPFWVVIPTLKVRDTCLCKQHENMELIIQSLRKYQIIDEKTSRDILTSLCCNLTDAKCLNRECNTCKNRQIKYKEFDNSKEICFLTWKNVKKQYVKDGLTKTAIQCVKAKITAFPKVAITEFEKMLKPYLKHCSNIVSQSTHIKKLKNNLGEHEVIVHCDFSENYGLKYAQEIQAMHFGSSRQQVTLHTVVIYYILDGNLQTQSFCTMSRCLRHDAVAIWEHLLPILRFIEDKVPHVDVLHFISDSPSGQYRNRKMFFVISKLHWHFPSLKFISWNYSEAGHGKGAPDGVGGVLKRSADQFVARGYDISDLESLLIQLKRNISGVLIEIIDESGIVQKDPLIPTLPKFTGTMQVHQAVWDASNKNVVALRKLSCSLDECATTSGQCKHGQHVGIFNLQMEIERDNIKLPRQTKASKKSYVKNTSKNISKATFDTIAHEPVSSDSVTIDDQPSSPAKKSIKKIKGQRGNLVKDKLPHSVTPPSFRAKSNSEQKFIEETTIKGSLQRASTTRFPQESKNIMRNSSPKNIVSKLKNQPIITKISNKPGVKTEKEKVQVLSNKLIMAVPGTSKDVPKNSEESGYSCVASDDSFWTAIPSTDRVPLTPTVGDTLLSRIDAVFEDSDEDYSIF